MGAGYINMEWHSMNESAPNAPLLEQAADRLSARYGTPKVVGFIGDDAFAVVMREDGRWARYEHGKGWTELPRLDAKVFACPCTEEIGPCPACAEGAVDA